MAGARQNKQITSVAILQDQSNACFNIIGSKISYLPYHNTFMLSASESIHFDMKPLSYPDFVRVHHDERCYTHIPHPKPALPNRVFGDHAAVMYTSWRIPSAG